METTIGQELKKILIPTCHSEHIFYEYILTPDEEKAVIKNSIESEMKDVERRMSGLGYLSQSIEIKLQQIELKAKMNEFELLDKANVRKHWQIQERQDLQKESEAERVSQNDLRNYCDAKYFFKLLINSFKAENRAFIQDEHSNPLIRALCFFMANDIRFQTELSHDLRKGLWIMGMPGLGKTRLIEGVAVNDLDPVNIVSMLTIADSVKSSGEYELGEFSKILFDDVGSEQPTVNHYGTKINWFKDFIELYYAKRQTFSRLMVTTNCTFDEIEEKYCYRVRSRIREMFNIIHLKGVDRRC